MYSEKMRHPWSLACSPIEPPRGRIPGEKGYQPLNCFLAETGSMLCSEMRDSNVPAREGNARVLSRARAPLPAAIEEVMIRSDSAGHSVEVLQLCNRPYRPELRPMATQRFGVVGFAISAARSRELMAVVVRVPEADWTPARVPEKTNAGRGRKTGACRRGLGGRGHRGSELPVERGRLQQARRDRPLHRRPAYQAASPPRRPDALGVHDDELPPEGGKPAYAIRALITNIPAPGEGRKDGLGPEPMAAQAVLNLINGHCGDAGLATLPPKPPDPPCNGGMLSGIAPGGGPNHAQRCIPGHATARKELHLESRIESPRSEAAARSSQGSQAQKSPEMLKIIPGTARQPDLIADPGHCCGLES